MRELQIPWTPDVCTAVRACTHVRSPAKPQDSLDIAFAFAGSGAFASQEHDDLGLAGVPDDSHVGKLFVVAHQTVVVGACDEDGFVVDIGHICDWDRFKFVRVQAVTLVLPERCTWATIAQHACAAVFDVL